MDTKAKANLEIAKRISVVSIIWNVALSVIKVIAGLLGNSGAMIADGIHSISDVATTVLAFWRKDGVKIC